MRRRALLALPLVATTAACGGSDRTSVDDAVEDAAPAPTSPSTATTPVSYAVGPVAGAQYVPPGLDPAQGMEYRYGAHPRQASDLWLPAGARREALLVLVHGGGWDATTDRRNLLDVVGDLVGRGWPVLNADYRGVGDGGGWPSTFTDVAAAVDAAAEIVVRASLPAERIGVVGHSAGGHLGMWAAARHTLAAGAPGAGPRVEFAAAASMSGVLHPTSVSRRGGYGNLLGLFGGAPDQVDERYALADPTRRVPLGMPMFVAHGTDDTTVPPTQAQEFTRAATAAGDSVDLHLLPGVGHTDPLDPNGQTVPRLRDWLDSLG